MVRIWQDRITRIQGLLWILVLIASYTILSGEASQDSRTILAALDVLLLLTVNALHFFKKYDLEELNLLSSYLSPSVVMSLLLQIILGALLIERFGLARFRASNTTEVTLTVSLIIYLLAGLVIGFLNFAPAIYRFQELRRKAKSSQISSNRNKAIAARRMIERYLLSFDLPADLDELERLHPNQIRERLMLLMDTPDNPEFTSLLFAADRWYTEKLREQDAADRPTLYIWATVVSAFVAAVFSLVASVLGLLDLLKSLLN